MLHTNGIGGSSEEDLMARRRYQQGGLRLVDGQWKLEWREDVVTLNGIKRVRKSRELGTQKDFPTERLARREADVILTKAGINSLDYKVGKISTFAEFVELWERDVLPMLKKSSQPADRSHVNKHLVPMLGETRLQDIGQRVVQGVIARLTEKGLCAKSIKNIITTLQAIMRVAESWEYRVGKFDNSVILPRRRIRPKGRSFTVEQAKEMIEQAPHPYNVMMIVAALTGLRMGELLGLRWEDIDLHRSILRVRQSAWRGEIQTTKSEDSERTVPIPSGLVQVLERYFSEWEENELGLLWADEKGGALDGDNLRHRMMRPLLDQVGVVGRAGFHAFRHLHGTLLVSVGANPKVAQAQLGHSDIKTTMELYADVVAEDHRKAVEGVSGRILALVGAQGGPKLQRVK